MLLQARRHRRRICGLRLRFDWSERTQRRGGKGKATGAKLNPEGKALIREDARELSGGDAADS